METHAPLPAPLIMSSAFHAAQFRLAKQTMISCDWGVASLRQHQQNHTIAFVKNHARLWSTTVPGTYVPVRMGSEASETLPIVRCPGCGERMDPRGVH